MGGGPGGGPNCASAVLGAAMAAPSNTLADRVRRVFRDIAYNPSSLELWLHGGGICALVGDGQGRPRRQGLQSATASGAAGGDRAIGVLLALRQREVQDERHRCRAEGVTHPATQAFCQFGDNPQASTRLDPCQARSVIGDSAVHPGTGTHELDPDFALAAVETGMADRVRH
jgi:hypothetical protein